jgi:hypothetical protein
VQIRGARKLADGLVHLVSESHGEVFRQLWTSTKIRKAARCCLCSGVIAAREMALRPITNQGNRWYRLHTSHIKGAK